jgi:hypothetical protein
MPDSHIAVYAGIDEANIDPLIDLFFTLGRYSSNEFSYVLDGIDVTGLIGTEALIDYFDWYSPF